MRHLFESGVCAFCTLDSGFNTILWEDEYVSCWAVPDAFMRKELLYHFIISPKCHVRKESELSQSEVLSIAKAHQYLDAAYQLKGGITATRFGDMRLNAGTVPHLHTNVMVPNGTGEVKIPVFKDPSSREKNVVRAREFGTRYEGGWVPDSSM